MRPSRPIGPVGQLPGLQVVKQLLRGRDNDVNSVSDRQIEFFGELGQALGQVPGQTQGSAFVSRGRVNVCEGGWNHDPVLGDGRLLRSREFD